VSSYIAENFSASLTDEDARILFDKLVKKRGSISKAVKECGIARKTPYLWETANNIDLKTKQKITRALLDEAFEETLAYLVKRYMSESLELLLINLSTLYEMALSEKSREKCYNILKSFEEIKNENNGIIVDKLSEEVINYIEILKKDSLVKEVNWSPKPFNVYKTEQIQHIIPLIARELCRGVSSEWISKQLNVSETMVHMVNSTLAEVQKTKEEEPYRKPITQLEGIYLNPGQTSMANPDNFPKINVKDQYNSEKNKSSFFL
jgi:hypothetical protein